MTKQIIPGIQEVTFPEIARKIRLVEQFVEWVQIDVTDNSLTTNESFRDPNAFRNLKTKVNLEVHLMTKDAVNQTAQWISAGFKRTIVHVEADHPGKLLNVKGKAEVGLALDGPSPVEIINPYLNKVDCVLIMMYKTGPSGQTFQEAQLEKVKLIHQKYPRLPIEVDGGMNETTIKMCENAGATRFVATSAIFKSDNIKHAIKKLQGIL